MIALGLLCDLPPGHAEGPLALSLTQPTRSHSQVKSSTRWIKFELAQCWLWEPLAKRVILEYELQLQLTVELNFMQVGFVRLRATNE